MPTVTPNLGLFKPLVNDPTDQDLWGGYLNENMDTLDTAVPNSTPSGIVAPFAGSSAPTNWLLCYGQAVSRTTYSVLFGIVGTTYGTGDGTTTFNVPDLRGIVPAGVDNMGGTAANRLTSASGTPGTTLGGTGGSQLLASHTHTGTVTINETPHAHQVQTYAGIGSGVHISSDVGGTGASGTTGYTSTGITASVAIAGAGTGNAQNVQPTIMLNYIIKT